MIWEDGIPILIDRFETPDIFQYSTLEMIADQKLGEARAKGDTTVAERELQRLRSLREVRP
jgi:hypothetical protein